MQLSTLGLAAIALVLAAAVLVSPWFLLLGAIIIVLAALV